MKLFIYIALILCSFTSNLYAGVCSSKIDQTNPAQSGCQYSRKFQIRTHLRELVITNKYEAILQILNSAQYDAVEISRILIDIAIVHQNPKVFQLAINFSPDSFKDCVETIDFYHKTQFDDLLKAVTFSALEQPRSKIKTASHLKIAASIVRHKNFSKNEMSRLSLRQFRDEVKKRDSQFLQFLMSIAAEELTFEAIKGIFGWRIIYSYLENGAAPSPEKNRLIDMVRKEILSTFIMGASERQVNEPVYQFFFSQIYDKQLVGLIGNFL